MQPARDNSLPTDLLADPAPSVVGPTNVSEDLAPDMLPASFDFAKPWQRMAVSLYTAGTGVVQVSKEVGVPVGQVVAFLTGKEGQRMVKELVSENADRFNDLFESAATDAVLTLVSVMHTGQKDSDRLTAANSLLARVKPPAKAQEVQARKTTAGSLPTSSDEAERLIDELKKENNQI